MTIVLEVTGGFTGKAGKQVIELDLDQLDPTRAAKLRRDLGQIPEKAWGGSFLSSHPKPWDFLHVLRVRDEGPEKTIRFHLHQGPDALSRIVEELVDPASLRPAEKGPG